MRHEGRSVECIGSLADVSLWELGDRIVSSSSRLGKWRGSVLGNDAVIVAAGLLNQGMTVKCQLLDPTDSDLAAASSLLGPDIVNAVGGRTGELTRSLCLEDSFGRRSWIFSRVPEPGGGLANINSDFVYIDYYPEFIEFLNQNLQLFESCNWRVIANLSALSPNSEIPRLTIKPFIVQASVPRDLSVYEARQFAMRLLGITSSKNAIVTMGPKGAILATGDKSWHADVPLRGDKTILGAGAMFSVEVIAGVSEGLEEFELLKSSVTRTALRLESSKSI